MSDGIRPRVAAIDCGTNSLRLLVADVGDDGRLTDVVRRMEIVRLGQGIDRTGVIAPEAMAQATSMEKPAMQTLQPRPSKEPVPTCPKACSLSGHCADETGRDFPARFLFLHQGHRI